MEHHRTEKQIEASKSNLRKGRRKVHGWTPQERIALGFPFGHRFPTPDSTMDPVIVLRWQMIGAQHPEGQGQSPAAQMVIGWREEKLETRKELVRKYLFGKRNSLTVEKLLQGLLPLVDGWPKRSLRVQEMIENFNALITVAGSFHYCFPEDRSFLLSVTRLASGKFSTGIYAGIPMLRVLSNPATQVDLELADHLVSLIVAYNDTFCTKSAAAYINAKKGVEKRKLLSP